MKRICLQLIVLISILFSQAVKAQNDAKPEFVNGEARCVHAFADKDRWIKEELWVETSFDSDFDGKLDRMHVFVTRPYQTDSSDLKLPVVYMSSPYYGLTIGALLGAGSDKLMWNVKHELGDCPKKRKHSDRKTRDKRPLLAYQYDRMWVSRGYVMVYSSSPGTGLSDGAITIGGENESLAPKAVIDWLCGRAKGYKKRTGTEEVKANWSTGKVGMMGTSYDGTLCIAAATTGVEGLEAIIPVAPVSSFYHYYRSNGLVRSPGGYVGEDVDVLYDFVNTGDIEKREKLNVLVRDSILEKNIDRETGDYNEFWASRDYLSKIGNMKAAMIMVHGFNDWNVMSEHSYRFYKVAKEKGLSVQLYYHQDDHGGDPDFSMINRWFTRYLHGIENGVEKDQPVAITREYKSVATRYDAFPDLNASDMTMYLNAKSNQSGELVLDKNQSNSFGMIKDDYRVKIPEFFEEKNAEHRLLYTTPFLTEDVRISGIPKVSVKLKSSESASNLSVYLVSLPWEKGKGVEIYNNIINRGWADPQNHQSISESEPLDTSKYYTVNFDLMPDDQVIRKGQQIGLMIFSSDKEFTLWPKPGTELKIDLKETKITLPIVGGENAYRKSVGLPQVKVKVKRIGDYLPDGFLPFDTIAGDLNKDGRMDTVLIIKGTDTARFYNDEYRGVLDRNRRGLMIFLGEEKGVNLVLENDTCYSSENEDGGVYFPPELSLEVKRGNLHISYGHGRYGHWSYNFRYNQEIKDFELIGYDQSDNYGPIVNKITSINYLSKRMKIVKNVNEETNDSGDEVFEESWQDIKIDKLINLSEIKDFDYFRVPR